MLVLVTACLLTHRYFILQQAGGGSCGECLLTVMSAAAIMGMVKNALLPIWPEDKKSLREHCTKHWLDSAGKKHDPMMSVKEYKEKPVSFLHKYCRHYTPEPAEQERLLRDIPRTMAHLVDPNTGLEVFREDGPTVKALENLIELVQAGKLQGTDIMSACGTRWTRTGSCQLLDSRQLLLLCNAAMCITVLLQCRTLHYVLAAYVWSASVPCLAQAERQ